MLKSGLGSMQKNFGGEIQSAGIYTQSTKKKKNFSKIDISKNDKISDDFCDFNEEEDDNSQEENLVVIQEEEKNIGLFEEDIKQIEEDLRLAGYGGENIDLFDISKLKGKIVSISKTNHGSRFFFNQISLHILLNY